jgi:hypothetical protein
MKSYLLAALSLLLLAGCGVAQPGLGGAPAGAALVAAAKQAPYAEALVTDASAQALKAAIQAYQKAQGSNSTLEDLQAVALRAGADGRTEALVSGVFDMGLRIEATVKAVSGPDGQILSLEDASTRGVKITPLPFKKAPAAELKALEPKLAAALKARWQAELVSIAGGRVLVRPAGTVYRLDAAAKPHGFPIGVQQSIEVQLDGAGVITALESL